MICRLANVEKEFNHPRGTFAIRIPELRIGRGEICVFRGPSGCGKSTLFDLIGLISRPTRAGSFQVGEESELWEVGDASWGCLDRVRGRLLGYVPQQGGLLASLTVMENILLPLRLNGLRADSEDVVALAGRLGLVEQLFMKPGLLSGGERQRGAIVRGVIHRPSILLADEPTGSVDRCTADEIAALLLDSAAHANAALLVATHDPSLFRNCGARLFSFNVRREGTRVESTLEERDPR